MHGVIIQNKLEIAVGAQTWLRLSARCKTVVHCSTFVMIIIRKQS